MVGHQKDLHKLIEQLSAASSNDVATALLANIQERVQTAERRLSELRDERERLQRDQIDEAEAAQAMAPFDPVWETVRTTLGEYFTKGIRRDSHAYIPDKVMAALQGDELAKAQQLQQLLKMLNNRQRQRKNANS